MSESSEDEFDRMFPQFQDDPHPSEPKMGDGVAIYSAKVLAQEEKAEECLETLKSLPKSVREAALHNVHRNASIKKMEQEQELHTLEESDQPTPSLPKATVEPSSCSHSLPIACFQDALGTTDWAIVFGIGIGLTLILLYAVYKHPHPTNAPGSL